MGTKMLPNYGRKMKNNRKKRKERKIRKGQDKQTDGGVIIDTGKEKKLRCSQNEGKIKIKRWKLKNQKVEERRNENDE